MDDIPAIDTQSVGFMPFVDVPVTFQDSFQDLDRMCRLCMYVKDSSSNMTMMDVSSEYPNTNTTVSQLFLEGLNIDITDASATGMPHLVCVTCLTVLHSYTNFKKRSLIVDAKLREMVNRKRKLAKAQALYGPIIFDMESSNQSIDDTSADPMYYELSDKAVPDNFVPALQREDDEVQESQYSKTPLCLEMIGNSGTRGEDNSANMDCITNCSENILERIEDIGEVDLTFREDCLGQDGISQDTSNFDVMSERVSTSDGNLEKCYSDNGACFNVDREIVITDTASEHPNMDTQKSKLDTVRQEIVSEKGKLPEHIGTIEDFPLQAVHMSLPSRGPRPAPLRNKKKQKHKKNSAPVPEVLVIEDRCNERRLAYRCTLCKHVSDSHMLFRRHILTHLKDKGAVCKVCQKWFKNQSTLARHERTHSGEKPFECVLCQRSFSQKEILQRHILTHTDVKPFRCQHCDKSYTQKEGLSSHIKHYHAKKLEIIQYPCPLCEKAFCHPSGLSRHMISHTGKQYECKTCSKRFTDISSLRRHSKSQHPETWQS